MAGSRYRPRKWKRPYLLHTNNLARRKGTIKIDTGVLIEIGFENLREDTNLDCTVYRTSSDGVLIFESGHVFSSDRDSRSGTIFDRQDRGAFA